MNTLFFNLNNIDMLKIKELVKDGAVIAYPTDTVYGLGCDPYNDEACNNIISLKNRPQNKSMILLVSKDFDLNKIAILNEEQKQIMKKLQGFSITFLLTPKESACLSPLVTNAGQSIAVRIPNGDFIERLLEEVKIITSTSCNISGQPILENVNAIKETFKNKLSCIIDGGDMQNAKPSTIVDIRQECKIIREGCITKQQIYNLLQV